MHVLVPPLGAPVASDEDDGVDRAFCKLFFNLNLCKQGRVASQQIMSKYIQMMTSNGASRV